MSCFSRSQLSDAALLQLFASQLTADRANTAELLSTLAEIDARRLYLPGGHPSMFAYCVGQWLMSEDMAYKRIRAARAGRRFPEILLAIEEGRLHLTAVVLLAPHLTRENAGELIAAATHQTKAGIERLLAERFPQPDLATLIRPIPETPRGLEPACEGNEQLVPEPVQVAPSNRRATALPAPGPVAEAPAARVKPLAPQRFAMQVTISEQTHEKLRRAQEMLSHAVPGNDLAEVLDRALDALITQLERQRQAKVSKPRPGRRTKSARHVPAHVRREVWKRDQGQCTFVSETGHRCPSRTRLEFDHVTPVARGGEATLANIRLRCRAHNQYEAERVFGESFMRGKRERTGERTAVERVERG